MEQKLKRVIRGGHGGGKGEGRVGVGETRGWRGSHLNENGVPTPFGGGQLLRPHRVLSNRARSLRHSVVSQIKKYTADEPDKINKKKKNSDRRRPRPSRTDRPYSEIPSCESATVSEPKGPGT